MFGLHVDVDVDADWCHFEIGSSRLKRDEDDVQKLMREFQYFDVITQSGEHKDQLVCLAMKDVIPEDITKEVLKAVETGQSLVESFVTERLMEKSKDFYSKLPRNKVPSVSRMYKVDIPTATKKQNDIKADRDLIHRLFVASQSGHDVNLVSILGHELSSVPRALSKTNGKLHTTDKAQL